MTDIFIVRGAKPLSGTLEIFRSLHSGKRLNAKRWMSVWDKAGGNVKIHSLMKLGWLSENLTWMCVYVYFDTFLSIKTSTAFSQNPVFQNDVMDCARMIWLILMTFLWLQENIIPLGLNARVWQKKMSNIFL